MVPANNNKSLCLSLTQLISCLTFPSAFYSLEFTIEIQQISRHQRVMANDGRQ